jgi:2',3'-cyclic-nucleotide 2'-phosphodiesterase/3'-nucleotidase
MNIRPSLGTLALALTLAWAAGGAAAQTLKLRILGTTDVHMHLVPYDYYQDKPAEEYGLARTATLIKAARAEVRNSLLVDNGDLIQGNPLGDFVARVRPLAAGQVHPAFKVMNAMGYDAANVGNHEFNYGLPFLRQALGTATFPYVSSNVVQDEGAAKGQPAFRPYVILERSFTDEAGQPQRLKVGVIGFVPPQIMLWDRGNLTGRVQARDIPSTARELVPKMRAEGADVVLAVPHSGF